MKAFLVCALISGVITLALFEGVPAAGGTDADGKTCLVILERGKLIGFEPGGCPE